jgi:drug/metabolite transporter (DMT)-like permease
MISVVLIWGINFSVIKLALNSFAPLAFNALRFSLATAVMLAVMRLRREHLGVPRRDLVLLIVLGLAGHTGYQVLFINGLARSTPANTALIMATAPLFVALYGQVLGIERISRVAWGGICLSFLGILLVIGGGAKGIEIGKESSLGDLLILGAAMLWAAYTTGSKPLLVRHSPVKVTTVSMLAGTLPLVLISMPQLASQDWQAVSPGGWAAVLYSALFSVAVGYVAWYTSVQRVGNARTAVYSNATPIVAILVGWLVLGDRLSLLQILGVAVVLLGIMLTRRGRAR